MRIVERPSVGASLVGGAIRVPAAACEHAAPRPARPWTGEEGTAGTVAVVGAGKMGLPLAAQFASHGWSVVAVDVNPAVVEAINAGRSHVAEEPGLDALVARTHGEGRLRATLDAAGAAAAADVVVVIVPVVLDDGRQPDFRHMDAAVASIAPGIHRGSLVVFETTLPVGTTRGRFAPALEAASGLVAEDDFFVAFSPERLFSGTVFHDLAAYPKLVGGLGPASTERAASFYAAVLDAEVVAMSGAEAAELSKLADTTYRDVNIAFANELAAAADRLGIDVQEVIAAANSQPYSHIHQPGIGVGGHCIPVYPHLLLAGAPDLDLVATSRRVNDGQVLRAVETVEALLGGLGDVPVLVLGLTYREGVRELAYSRAIPLLGRLADAGAETWAYDPLLTADEVAALGARPWSWGRPGPFRAVIAQTGDPRFGELDAAWFAELQVLYDGRNRLRDLALPAGVTYVGVGVQHATRRRPGRA